MSIALGTAMWLIYMSGVMMEKAFNRNSFSISFVAFFIGFCGVAWVISIMEPTP